MVDLSDTLVVGISSRSLFNLEEEEALYQQAGLAAYSEVQRQKEQEILQPGSAFYLVKALLNLNQLCPDHRLVEVIVMSRNSPDTGLRVLNSIQAHGLDIVRSAFTGGEPIAPYVSSFGVDLFLSKNEEDVRTVFASGAAASALLLEPPETLNEDTSTVRIAFDADAVLFSEISERIYQTEGLEAFAAHELQQVEVPLPEGPHAKLLHTLSRVQELIRQQQGEPSPLRIAIVTARSGPSHLRVIHTLRAWHVAVDEAFFLGDVSKAQVLKSFRAHIFFDDQDLHLAGARHVVASGKVPSSLGL